MKIIEMLVKDPTEIDAIIGKMWEFEVEETEEQGPNAEELNNLPSIKKIRLLLYIED